MNTEQLILIKQAIETQLHEVTDEITMLESLAEPLVEDRSAGRLSRIAAIAEKNMSDAALHNANLRMIQLKQALHDSDSPDFGICAICAKPIPIARLLLIPESTVCVHCAEKQEG